MEQSRVFIAITLSLIVFIIWGYFFSPPPEKQLPEPSTQQASEQTSTDTVEKPTPTSSATALPVPAPSQPQTISANISHPAKEITIRTPLYTTKISEQGAVVKSFITNRFKETIEKNSPPKELIVDNDQGTLQLGFVKMDPAESNNALYVADIDSENLQISKNPQSISFTWISPQGMRFIKTFTFNPNSYIIDLTVSVNNQSTTQSFSDNMYLSLTNKASKKKGGYGFTGSCGLIDQKLQQVKPDNDQDTVHKGHIQWIAYQNRYFMTSIIPHESIEGNMQVQSAAQEMVQTKLLLPLLSISPGNEAKFEFQIFMGPKSVDLLKSIGHNLDLSIDFGWFGFLAKPCLWLMKFIYKNIVSNYGVAIIILTILIKVLLWPLGTKSYKSMNEMKKLQPLMTEIREKYKDDKRKMNEEIMGLYKTYKVNPMGGCLPMIAQIPIFFAFYRMLYDAFELRHAPFFGWINDLSAPDRLFIFHVDFKIPYMLPPYGIPVLTIIMGASMILQQKLSPPTGGDPTQAKMMMFMPIIFTFIFINFSSGLVLYWLVNNILSIGQQYYISKKYA